MQLIQLASYNNDPCNMLFIYADQDIKMHLLVLKLLYPHIDQLGHGSPK